MKTLLGLLRYERFYGSFAFGLEVFTFSGIEFSMVCGMAGPAG